MKILVACEESQAVTKEFRALGHEAYSCDIIDHSGEHDDWHIKQDVTMLLNGSCTFKTVDGTEHEIVGKWDMIIGFPPCTHLAVSGARHFEAKRADGRQRAGIELFCSFLKADCEKVAIENPIGIISGDYIPKWFPDLAEKYGLPIKPTQIIQPYEYGHKAKKSTCLWLKGLPKLQPTNIVEPELIQYTCKNGKTVTFGANYVRGLKDRAKDRSKTFEGVAKAMAEQWGKSDEMARTVHMENDQRSITASDRRTEGHDLSENNEQRIMDNSFDRETLSGDVKMSDWRTWNIGDKVTYAWNEFDGKGSIEGEVKEKYADHLIIAADGMALWCDDSFAHMFRHE